MLHTHTNNKNNKNNNTHAHIYTYTHTRTYTYIHIHTHTYKYTYIKHKHTHTHKESQYLSEDRPKTRSTRDEHQAHKRPIIAILGHLDHGKTTLLDAMRGGTHVAESEAGCITQEVYTYAS